ncbi:hypothetical protein [Shinella sp.]|jgi:hypothetical protein|uniref:hypothetical protein n=1 Tax=Shinella sp. TaxID=1870904 RepID=UPI003F6EAC5E
MRYAPKPLPPNKGLEGEDNYQIMVFAREGGDFLGYALKTTMNVITSLGWENALQKYPGCYLIEVNGPYALRTATAPIEAPDGRLTGAGEICLSDLPQWYGLKGICSCGKEAIIDRHHPKVQKWKGYPLDRIAEKLNCTACETTGRPRGHIKIEPFKLPR